jgi:plasmid stabilization system protein ParE
MPSHKRTVIWSPEAEQDLFDISAYLTAEACDRTAEKNLRKIGRTCERIRSRPLSGRARSDLMSDVRSVLVHPYVVFYRIAKFSVAPCINGETWTRFLQTVLTAEGRSLPWN